MLQLAPLFFIIIFVIISIINMQCHHKCCADKFLSWKTRFFFMETLSYYNYLFIYLLFAILLFCQPVVHCSLETDPSEKMF